MYVFIKFLQISNTASNQHQENVIIFLKKKAVEKVVEVYNNLFIDYAYITDKILIYLLFYLIFNLVVSFQFLHTGLRERRNNSTFLKDVQLKRNVRESVAPINQIAHTFGGKIGNVRNAAKEIVATTFCL